MCVAVAGPGLGRCCFYLHVPRCAAIARPVARALPTACHVLRQLLKSKAVEWSFEEDRDELANSQIELLVAQLENAKTEEEHINAMMQLDLTSTLLDQKERALASLTKAKTDNESLRTAAQQDYSTIVAAISKVEKESTEHVNRFTSTVERSSLPP